MSDWDLLTPGIGLTSIGIVGVVVSLSGIAKTFIDGMHAVSLLTMFIGMIFLASGLFKDGFPSSGRAKSATFITLGFLVTFGFAGAVTVSVQVPSIYAYIGLMIIIAIPATVLAVASFRRVPYIKALAVIFIGASIVGGTTFYAFGLVTPRSPEPEEGVEGGSGNATSGGSNATAPAEGNQSSETADGNQSTTGAAPGNQSTGAPATGGATVTTVAISVGASVPTNNEFYVPETVETTVGSMVTWRNDDTAIHTATSGVVENNAPSPDGRFDSGFLNKGQTFSFVFEEAGDYPYYCTVHPFMTGHVTVN